LAVERRTHAHRTGLFEPGLGVKPDEYAAICLDMDRVPAIVAFKAFVGQAEVTVARGPGVLLAPELGDTRLQLVEVLLRFRTLRTV
jgi:hypothetical protein